MITNLSPSGKVFFYFENIMLPDTSTNKERAQGFVRYSIAHKKNITDFTPISNVAGIVFDSNMPIMTNKVTNTLVSSLDGLLPVSKEMKATRNNILFPNPARDIVQIKGIEFSYIEVFDYTGKKILKATEASINVADWNNGIFLFNIYDKAGNLISKQSIVKY